MTGSIMVSEYDEMHVKFIKNVIMFELYDELTKKTIYDFYDTCSNVRCFLPRDLQQDNSLSYYLEFEDPETNLTDKMVKVMIKSGDVVFS